MKMLRMHFSIQYNSRYKCDINITELITLEDAMNEFTLGPNGGSIFIFEYNTGLLFCMEFLLKNIQWLFDRLKEYPSKNCTLL